MKEEKVYVFFGVVSLAVLNPLSAFYKKRTVKVYSLLFKEFLERKNNPW